MEDKNQKVFEDFSVPDPIRIKKAVDFIKSKFKNLNELSVLELGMAKGGVADSFKDSGARCFGIDVNPRQMKGVKIKQADLNLGIPDFGIKFNVVFAGEVMEHIFDDQRFLENCRDVLMPGGYLIITVPNLFFLVNRFTMFFGKMPYFAYATYHYHMYGKKILSNMFSSNGFRVKKIISSHILYSTRRNAAGKIFEALGNVFPSLGAHLIIFGEKIN
ncbi:MAG: class I SAM-dependent methyltransferase [Candidatus Wolfebacteria bacterium]|nr:class I SAM-dependent methyltransferase [Candidatus Wolfebacteria bacterium]